MPSIAGSKKNLALLMPKLSIPHTNGAKLRKVKPTRSNCESKSLYTKHDHLLRFISFKIALNCILLSKV